MFPLLTYHKRILLWLHQFTNIRIWKVSILQIPGFRRQRNTGILIVNALFQTFWSVFVDDLQIIEKFDINWILWPGKHAQYCVLRIYTPYGVVGFHQIFKCMWNFFHDWKREQTDHFRSTIIIQILRLE